jgi:hypothetical protein
MASRVSAIYWGGNFQSTLFLGYPLKSVITDREPRAGTSLAQAPSGIEDSWIAYDYTLECEGQFLPAFPNADGAGAPYAQQTAISGPTGIQAFLDYARAKGTFRFVPDVTLPKFWVDGCYLKDPASGGRSLSPRFDWHQKFTFRNPTIDFGVALRGLFLEYASGASLADPVAYTLSSRVNPGFQIGQKGILTPVAATMLRDRHYYGGLRTTLVEGSTSNWCLQSQTLATAPWSPSNITLTNNAATAPDGTTTATSLIPNTTAGVNHFESQAVTITANEFLAASIFVKANGYTLLRLWVADVLAGTNGFKVDLDLTTGLLSTAQAVGTGTYNGSTVVALANGWYWVGLWGAIGNAATTAQVMALVYPNLAGAGTPYAGNGTSGLYAWGAQLERNGTAVKSPPTSYIATTTGALGRNPDTLQMTPNWPWPTQPLWVYAKFIDFGWSQRAQFEELLKWTNTGLNQPMIRMLTGSGSGGQTPNHRFNYSNGLPGVAGANQAAAQVTPGANYGDTVELFARVFSDGSTEIQRSINGAAAVTGSSGGGPGGLPDFFDIASYNALGAVFYLNVAATIGLIRLKIGPGTSQITTLAQGAAA